MPFTAERLEIRLGTFIQKPGSLQAANLGFHQKSVILLSHPGCKLPRHHELLQQFFDFAQRKTRNPMAHLLLVLVEEPGRQAADVRLFDIN